jgi:hypothetical protein
MQIRYQFSILDCWRCWAKFFLTRPVIALMLAYALLFYPVASSFPFGHFSGYRFFVGLLRLAMVLIPIMGFVTYRFIRRPSTTTLTYESACNLLNGKPTVLRWSDVTLVRNLGGDVLIRGPFADIIVPRSAFKSPADAQAFADAAKRINGGDYSPLQQRSPGCGGGMIDYPPAEPGVWPPAPGQMPYTLDTSPGGSARGESDDSRNQ